jgi:uncharacterized membrane protein YdjX (TVP38/TMEM64 family)
MQDHAKPPAPASADDRRPRASVRTALRWLPIAIVAVGLAAGYVAGLQDYLSLAALQKYEGALAAAVADRPGATAAAYLAIYVVAVAISFPGASLLTIAGGFLFGLAAGGALAWAGATIGATAIFLAARTSLGHLLAAHAGGRIERLRRGFQDDGFNYLLFLRLVPLFPFWVVNLSAGLLGMRLVPYVAATAIGILPGTFVFCYFGQGLRNALKSETPALSLELVIALTLLGLLALVPAVLRRMRRRAGRAAS